MEVYNGRIAVTYGELTSSADGEQVMGRSTLNMVLYRHPELRLSSGGGLGSACRIDYYGLRECYRRRYEAKHGDPRKVLAAQALRAELHLTIDERARNYYRDYRYELRGEQTALPESVIEELTVNASVLNRMWEILTRRSVMRTSKTTPMSELLETSREMYEKLRDAYDHTLPASMERLRSKLNAYKRDGYGVLISRKYGNSNSLVVTEEGQEYLIALKRSRVPVYTDAMIFDAYNRMCADQGWKPVKTLRTLLNWLNQPEIKRLWLDARMGEKNANYLWQRKHKTQLPTMRDSIWYGDGTKLNLFFRECVDGKWVVRTTQVYEVIDAYSEALLGYCISDTEDWNAQYAAYRMALTRSGHRPYELVHDNQGGHNKQKAQEFLDRLPVGLHRPTAPYSGQSKTIESVFGRFQSQYLSQAYNFTGMNITAKKWQSRANIETVAANIDKLPTRAELPAIYESYREQWNAAAHPSTGVSRMEMYQSSVNPDCPALSERDLVDLLWQITDKPVTYTECGLQVQIDRKKHTFEVHKEEGTYDYDFLEHNRGRKYYVKYDPCDLSSVRLYSGTPDGDLRFERVAVPPVVIHRGKQEQEAGEQAFIRANIEATEEMRKRRQTDARVIEHKFGMSVEQQGLTRPKMPGSSVRSEDEIERGVHRRTRDLPRNYGKMSPGQIGKLISLMVYDPLTGEVDNGDENYRQVAKL